MSESPKILYKRFFYQQNEGQIKFNVELNHSTLVDRSLTRLWLVKVLVNVLEVLKPR